MFNHASKLLCDLRQAMVLSRPSFLLSEMATLAFTVPVTFISGTDQSSWVKVDLDLRICTNHKQLKADLGDNEEFYSCLDHQGQEAEGTWF